MLCHTRRLPGKGRGRQVIAVARTADVVIMMLDATKGDVQRCAATPPQPQPNSPPPTFAVGPAALCRRVDDSLFFPCLLLQRTFRKGVGVSGHQTQQAQAKYLFQGTVHV